MRQFDSGTLKRAIEDNDPVTLSGLFAENAMLRIVDSIHPPSHPLDMKGRKKIAEFYDEVCGRGIAHRVGDMVSSDGHLAFTEECEYPGGAKVFLSAMLDIDENGRIARQVMVQAWDDDDR